ncbi:recombinase family protein [Nonomuraea sp. NPDC049421]|uniref:recombinase family protein n=1 Tax=Nonomuraea sp. NPDC049421 TaxID=3155275 RepID=UPI003413829E
MKLSGWARRNGVHYQTAWQWAREGKLPVLVTRTATGRYLVLERASGRDGRAVAFCRVSSAGQKADLERQAGRVVTAATGRGLTVAEVVSEVVAEVASGLNGRRPKPASLLRDSSVPVFVVDDDLARDKIDVLSSLCSCLYGRRLAARRAGAALRAVREAT